MYLCIISWLERRFLVKTFEEIGEDENLEQSIQEIGQALDDESKIEVQEIRSLLDRDEEVR